MVIDTPYKGLNVCVIANQDLCFHGAQATTDRSIPVNRARDLNIISVLACHFGEFALRFQHANHLFD